MKSVKFRNWLLVVITSVFLSACASLPGCKPTSDAEPDAETTPDTPIEPEIIRPPRPTPPEPPEPEDPDFGMHPDETGNTVKQAVDDSGQPVDHQFQFDFDMADIGSTDFGVLQVHADVLVRNRDQSIVIEGHCDERGTREYNLALGERRAKAIGNFLMSAGVRSSQISTVSFGEEVPLDAASTEAAWAKNRRAVIRYQ